MRLAFINLSEEAIMQSSTLLIIMILISAAFQHLALAEPLPQQLQTPTRPHEQDFRRLQEQLQKMTPEEHALYHEINTNEHYSKTSRLFRQGKNLGKRMRNGRGNDSSPVAQQRHHLEQRGGSRYGIGYETRMMGIGTGETPLKTNHGYAPYPRIHNEAKSE